MNRGPVPLDRVAGVLPLDRHELVALVGGGGKTTLLLALGRQLEGTVLLTSTTKMGLDRTGGHEVLWSPADGDLVAALTRHRTVLAWRDAGAGKAQGFAPEQVDRWFDLSDQVVVEADGSRGLPFKAPSPHEPVVPSRTTLVLVVAGADALDRVIEDQCHRPLRVAALAGCRPYDRLTPERAARVLLAGWSRCVPTAARSAVVITKVDPASRGLVDELAERLVREQLEVVSVLSDR